MYNIIRDHIEKGTIKVVYRPTDDMLADHNKRTRVRQARKVVGFDGSEDLPGYRKHYTLFI
jgi:hypothetical protein